MMCFLIQYTALVSTHSRLKAAGAKEPESRANIKVSTHSRLKAAGAREAAKVGYLHCFNTQPPEGGWDCNRYGEVRRNWFQHTAA